LNRFAITLVAFLAGIALPLLAQQDTQDDKTFLENWLEKNLSAAGRQVTVTGFDGALSSRATLDVLTIADDEGVWLTLTDAQLDWTRSALLQGRLEIDSLSAEKVAISRRPVAVYDGPTATASDFALPELPVSIDIGTISVSHVELGAPVLGVDAVLQLNGSGRIAAGEGEAQVALERIDGATGRFALSGQFTNATRMLGLDLELSEGRDGIVATLTGLPGGAPLDLTLSGRGPIDEFDAALNLSTDGASRISGRLSLSPGDMAATETAPKGASALAFRAELTGNPDALLAPEYRGFFGSDASLGLDGQRAPDGRTRIDTFTVATDALRMSGSALLGATGWPERVRLSGAIGAEGGGSVRLPIGGVPMRLTEAELAFDYDAQQGDGWQGRIEITGLDRPALQIETVSITGAGTLDRAGADVIPQISGHLDLRVGKLAAADGSSLSTIGDTLQGKVDFVRTKGAPLSLSNIALEGADYRLAGDLELDTEIKRLDVIGSGAVTLAADDLGRFSSLAGQTLSGAAKLAIKGTAALPGGPFNVQIDGTGRDLGIGRTEVDRLFAGESTFVLVTKRDESGTRIDRFEIDAPGATADISGLLAPTKSYLDAKLGLPDASLVATGLKGPVVITAGAKEAGALWDLTLDASAPGSTHIQAVGTADIGPKGLGNLTGSGRVAIGDLAAYSGPAQRQLAGRAEISAAGRYDPVTDAFELSGSGEGAGLSFGHDAVAALIAGDSRTSFAVRRDDSGTLTIETLNFASANLTVQATGENFGAPRVSASAELRDLAVLAPGLTGPFAVTGEAVLADTGWMLTASGTGPGGTDLGVSGSIASNGSNADLAIRGRAPLSFANAYIAPRQISGMAAFDLRLSGPIALSSLNGNVVPEGARLSMPSIRLSLDPVSGNVRLANGQATLDLKAQVQSGGRVAVTGPIGIAAPYASTIALELSSVRLTDPNLFDVTADARMTISGPLAGGARIAGEVNLGKAELQIPETGFGIGESLDGLRHVGEPANVRATRARAGMTGSRASGAGVVPYALDLVVQAPRSVFVRGRGLDAEFGGRIVLAGTTTDVIPRGGFDLIRGRLDILGNRLTLTEGKVTMRGSLDPAIYLVAETRAGDVDVLITIEGTAADPNVMFSSSPALPEDEIVAHLVFGRGIDQISAFQALKLASAVATLSGKSGAGTIGRLREGFGLADLDVTTNEEGNVEGTAGAYISENIYTDVTVGADGRRKINLNLSIAPSITAKGSVSSDGNTGIGIYFEKDY